MSAWQSESGCSRSLQSGKGPAGRSWGDSQLGDPSLPHIESPASKLPARLSGAECLLLLARTLRNFCMSGARRPPLNVWAAPLRLCCTPIVGSYEGE